MHIRTYRKNSSNGVEGMESRREPLPYYMAYPVSDEERDMERSQRDKEYFRQLYPREIKQYIKAVRKTVDGVSGKDSFIYDEYPDYIRLERLVEIIVNDLPLDHRITREGQKHIVRILLYEEIYDRRR